MTTLTPTSPNETSQGIRRWAIQTTGAGCSIALVLFLAAGRLDWAAGWAFLGLNLLTQALSAIVLLRRQPGMIAERSQIHSGTKTWDRPLVSAIAVITLAVLVIAGLDVRFAWSAPLGTGWWIAGWALAFASQVFVLWAMATNAFFATTVRIQADRGQQVVDSGPYRLVRHPGYSGSLIYNLATPLALGSIWAFIPVGFLLILLVVRTRLEDRTLQSELPGYPAYAARVRSRLIPGIW